MFILAAAMVLRSLGAGPIRGTASVDAAAPTGQRYPAGRHGGVRRARHPPARVIDALSDQPTGAEYLALPTTFWVVKFYDLGIVAPAALAVGIGLLRRQPWARNPAYGILGGYVLLGWSVAGMGWNMMLSADPHASLGVALGMSGLAATGTVFAYFLYRPLLRATMNQSAATTARVPAGRPPSHRKPT